MKKIAVIFPGIGYTAQKPLLYYTASAAQDEGYQLLKLDYGEDIHTFRGRKEEELKPLIEKAQERVKKQKVDIQRIKLFWKNILIGIQLFR